MTRWVLDRLAMGRALRRARAAHDSAARQLAGELRAAGGGAAPRQAGGPDRR